MTDDLEKRLKDLEEKFSKNSGRSRSNGLGGIVGGLLVGGFAYLCNSMVKRPLKTGLVVFGALMGTMIMLEYNVNQAIQSYGQQQEEIYSTPQTVKPHRTEFAPSYETELYGRNLIPIQNKESIPDLESEVNNILSSSDLDSYRVVKDEDRNLDEYSFTRFVIPARIKDKYFPYIVAGDFNGDGFIDIASIVISDADDIDKRREHIMIALSNENKTNDIKLFRNIWDAIVLFSGRQVDKRFGQQSINLKGDGIVGIRYESASRLMYWDGDAFKEYQMGD